MYTKELLMQLKKDNKFTDFYYQILLKKLENYNYIISSQNSSSNLEINKLFNIILKHTNESLELKIYNEYILPSGKRVGLILYYKNKILLIECIKNQNAEINSINNKKLEQLINYKNEFLATQKLNKETKLGLYIFEYKNKISKENIEFNVKIMKKQ